MNRPVVLVFVAYYLPGYKSGGPVRTISNMVARLGDRFDFRIVTSDRDATESVPYSSIAIDEWNSVGNAQVFYASPRHRSLAKITKLIARTPHDVLYLNSFFNFTFTVRPLLARKLGLIERRPTILAPRGEFSSGALALKSGKKKMYLGVAKSFGLYSDLTWHASSELEANDIRAVMGVDAQRFAVAPNLSVVATDKARNFPGTGQSLGRLRVCFVSRISPKKNLDFALQVLKRASVDVELDIFGVIDDERYWSRCRQLISQMPTRVVVRYCGVVDHETVLSILPQYDLFILPTLGENFGHAIFESLAAGTPVLISDTTPWRDLQRAGVGWDFSLSEMDAFVGAVNELARVDPTERLARRAPIVKYAAQVSNNDAVLESNARLFADLVSGRS